MSVIRRPLCVAPGGAQFSQRTPVFSRWHEGDMPETQPLACQQDGNLKWLWPPNSLGLTGVIDPQPPTLATPFYVNHAGTVDARSFTATHTRTTISKGDYECGVFRAWVLLLKDSALFGTNPKFTADHVRYNQVVQHSRWYPLTRVYDYPSFEDYGEHWFTDIWTTNTSRLPAEFLIAFDTAVGGYRMPYPIPVVSDQGSQPVIGPDETATVTGLACTSNWTIAAHVAFDESWDSFWAASAESTWPLLTIWADAQNWIQIIMARNSAGTLQDPKANQLQSIKAMVYRNGSSAGTISLPEQFYAHSGSPIWLAVSQRAEGLRLGARIGGGAILRSLAFPTALVNPPSEVRFSDPGQTRVTPTLVFSAICDPSVALDDAGLVSLLSGSILITG